jgi:hypothetical protein
MSSLKDQTLLLSSYHSSFVFRMSCFQISPKRLVVLTDILRALPSNLSNNCFLRCDKPWMFDSWNMWSIAIQHHKIFCMWVKNTGNSRYITSYWKLYLAKIVPKGVWWYVPHQQPLLVEPWAFHGILARLAQCSPCSVGRSNVFIIRIHTEVCT